MAQSERQKMAAGKWYNCVDAELDHLRMVARRAVHAHSTLAPDERGPIAAPLQSLFEAVGQNTMIEAPFHCAYGMNISLGANVYLNAGCTILDTAPVIIGAQTMLGPAVQIYCANHHMDPEKRAQGLEIAQPVTIGSRVWIGGGAIILPGVNVGNDAIIGAGAVVTRDVARGATVVGNPARMISTGGVQGAR